MRPIIIPKSIFTIYNNNKRFKYIRIINIIYKMSNIHSKLITQNTQKTFADHLTYDKLVLKLEEVDTDTGDIDMSCFIAYDQNDEEYYICGKRHVPENKANGMYSEDFKFYCKSSKQLFRFLEYIIDYKLNKVNHILYNFKELDLHDVTTEEKYKVGDIDQDYVDYYVLQEGLDIGCEITGYDEATYDRGWLKPVLKMLKYVRY